MQISCSNVSRLHTVSSHPHDVDLTRLTGIWCRYGPASGSYSTSDGSSFSGFHDSAASMALGNKGRKLANGTAEVGSVASGSNNSSHHSGRSNGSAASSGNVPIDVSEQQLEQPASGTRHADGTLKRTAMAAVPEDPATVSPVIKLFKQAHISLQLIAESGGCSIYPCHAASG